MLVLTQPTNRPTLAHRRYGDAKVIPAIDVMLKDGFDATIEIMKKGTDIRYNTGAPSAAALLLGAGGLGAWLGRLWLGGDGSLTWRGYCAARAQPA